MDFLTTVNAEEMLDKNDDQEDFLARVKHLSGEDITNTSSTRLNFGMKEVNENRVRNGLNLGSGQNIIRKNVTDKGYLGVQAVKEKPKKSPIKKLNQSVDTNSTVNTQKYQHVISQTETTHDVMISHPLTTSIPTGPLSMLASQHLGGASGPGPTGFTLGSLASISGTAKPSLSGPLSTNPLSGNGKITGIGLKTLASHHLYNSDLGVSKGLVAPIKQDSGPSLRNLASNHLASTSSDANSKFILGSFKSPSSASSDGSSKFTLGFLAKSTSASLDENSKFTLGTLACSSSSSSNASTKFTLGSLASSHLGSSNPTEKTNPSQFTIPAIFGDKLLPSTPPAGIVKERSVSPEVEIDLMSALKLSNTEQMIIDEELPTEMDTLKVEIIVPDISRIRSDLRKRKRSSFSKVITKKWTRIQMFQPLNIYLPTNNISVFNFEEPSPDDIVIKAQSMSRAFTRQTPVRK